MTVPFDEFADLVRARRTHMFVDLEREVPEATIDQLCELATWAPNHKRTWPWRFAHLTGSARARLGDAFADDMTERDFGDDIKRAKTRTKYLRTPSILVVASAEHHNPTLHDENRDSVSAGVQNLLLGATALGLATFWSTPGLSDSSRARKLCGFDPTDTITAVIYVGWPRKEAQPATPPRPELKVQHLTE
jgi:nitroreductase